MEHRNTFYGRYSKGAGKKPSVITMSIYPAEGSSAFSNDYLERRRLRKMRLTRRWSCSII
jgi:hypothetical protein